MADLRARSSAPSPADSGVFSSIRSAAAAYASAPAASSPQAELRDQCEQLGEQLLAVRDYLALLADCCAANTDSSAPIDTESLHTCLGDMADQLGETVPAFDALSDLATEGQYKLRRDIEQQGNAIYAVRHLLLTLYAALGVRSGRQHQLGAEAFGATMDRLARRIGAVEAALMDLAYDRTAAASAPPPPPAPAAPAATAAAPVEPSPATQMPVKPRKPRVPSRIARAVRASQEAAACA